MKKAKFQSGIAALPFSSPGLAVKQHLVGWDDGTMLAGLLVTKGIATSSKDATSSKAHYY